MQNTGLVISLNSDCIALVPLWPKSRAVSQIFDLVKVKVKVKVQSLSQSSFICNQAPCAFLTSNDFVRKSLSWSGGPVRSVF